MLEFLQNLGRSPVQLLGQNPLLIKLKVAEHLAQVTVYHVFDRSVHASEHHMVTATERLRLDPQVHLQMREEVDVFAGLERHEGLEAAHSRGDHDELDGRVRIHLALDDLGAHLAHVELVDSVHLEGGTIQTAVLPPEPCRCRVILGIVLAARWQSIDIEVLEFVDPGDRVRIQHAEGGRPSLKYIVRKDVQLRVLRLILEHVNAF